MINLSVETLREKGNLKEANHYNVHTHLTTFIYPSKLWSSARSWKIRTEKTLCNPMLIPWVAETIKDLSLMGPYHFIIV